MAGVYLDTSALGRLMLDEPDADAIGAALDGFTLVSSSRLLRIELRRLATRTGVPDDEVEAWLQRLALVPLSDSILEAAETVAPTSVATLDAIHLATALQLVQAKAISALMTFDARLASGAREHGLTVLAPRSLAARACARTLP